MYKVLSIYLDGAFVEWGGEKSYEELFEEIIKIAKETEEDG
jgi:DNA polymerase elongation subunit (family B)